MRKQAIATRPQVFSEYLRWLESSDEPPERASTVAVLEALRRILRYEIEKRGLWDTPPSYLGVYGLQSWSSADWKAPYRADQSGDEWDLVMDCFKYVFLDRYRYLTRQLATRPNIEGLIHRNVRNFLHDTQKKRDPLGFRIFTTLRAAVLRAVDEGELFVLRGDSRIRNHTVLGCVEEVSAEHPDGAALAEVSRSWNDVLLPDLVTARGRHQETVVAMLRNLLLKLPLQGIEIFRFGDLIDPLKQDARVRWARLFEGPDGTVTREGWDGELLRVVRLIDPGTSLEHREAFAELVDCVARAIEAIKATPATRRYATKLWSFLRVHAADHEVAPATGGLTPPGDSGRDSAPHGPARDPDLPSRRELSRLLGIPRNRMAHLFATLGELVAGCRGSRDSAPAVPKASAGQKPRKDVMGQRRRAFQKLQQGIMEMRRRAADGVAGLPSRDQGGVSAGDLLLLGETAELGLEWAVLSCETDAVGRCLIVPADVNPLVGSCDVAVPREAPAGPLTLRCAFGVWLDRGDLAAQPRVGALDAATVERARRKRQQLEDGTVTGSEVEREVDADPEYGYWIEDVLVPARAAFGEPRSRPAEPPLDRVEGSPDRHRRSPLRNVYGIAASVLLLVSLGLVGTLLQSNQDRRRLEEAQAEARQRISELERRAELDVVLDPVVITLHAWDALRSGTQTVMISPETPLVILLISVDEPRFEHRLEISRQPGGREVWAGDVTPNAAGELSIAVSTHRLPAGEYTLELSVLSPGESRRLGSLRLQIAVP